MFTNRKTAKRSKSSTLSFIFGSGGSSTASRRSATQRSTKSSSRPSSLSISDLFSPRHKRRQASLGSSKTLSTGASTIRKLEFTKSSVSEVPFDDDKVQSLISTFKDIASKMKEETIPDSKLYNDTLNYAADSLGIRIVRLGSTSGWQFEGFNAAEATKHLGTTMEDFPLTYGQAKIALFYSLLIVLDKMKKRNRQFYSLRTVKRSEPGHVTRRFTLLKTVKRRLSNVPGLKDLSTYKLPRDLRRVFGALGVKYNPKLNPRIRRLKKGQARNRFVFAYYDVSPVNILRTLLQVNILTLVRVSRNWQAICPFVITKHPRWRVGSQLYTVRQVFDWIIDNEDITRKGFCGILVFANHAFVMYGYLQGTKLNLFLLDPHASAGIARAYKEEFQSIKRMLAEEGKKGKGSRLNVVLKSSNEQCQTARGLVAVQPPAEGSCAIASIALMFNVARLLRQNPKLIRPKSHKTFCEKAYNQVRIQDAIFATQLSVN